MSEDVGAFPVGSAYVQVDPNAEGFAEALEEQIGDVQLVVQIPVVPDASGLQASVDAAAADAKATVVVPVTADPAGLQESVDAAVKESGAVVTVPMEADPADLASQAGAAADGAATGAGTTFGEKFSSVAGQLSLFAPDEGQMASASGSAGGSAGTSFGGEFESAVAAEGAAAGARLNAILAEDAAQAGRGAAAGFSESFSAGLSDAVAASTAAWGEIPVAAEDAARAAVLNTTQAWGALVPAAETAGTEAGEAAGSGFVSRLASMLSGVTSMFSGMIPGAAAEGDAAGEAAGEGFVSRFGAMVSGVTGSLSGLIPGMAAEGEAGGEAAGEGFASRFRSIIMGDISPMEALMGAGFIAVAADMASKFQAAMELVHTQAGVAQSAIAGLGGSVLTLAGQVGESPDSLAQALYHIESSFQSVGITGSKALALLQTAAEGARTGGADLVDVTNALDATIASGVGGVNSYSQAMGALNAIVGAGDMTMQDLADAMGSGLMANAKLYGQSLQQVGAALATLGDNNVRGAKAATDLRMAWQALLSPLTTAGPMLASIGLNATQLGHTLEHSGMTASIQEFVQHLQASKVPVSEWGTYVTDIFGKKAGSGIGIMIDQLGRLQSKLPDIEKGANDFGSAWAATQATTSQKLKELESSFETLMIKIGAVVLPGLDKIMTGVNNALPGIEKFAGQLGRIAQPLLKTYLDGIGTVVRGIARDLTGALPGLEKFAETLVKAAAPVVATFFTQLAEVLHDLIRDVTGVLPFLATLSAILAKVASPLVSLFFIGLAGIFKLLLGPLKDVTIAVGALAAAWTLLNVIMDLNPFVAIGTAIVILVGLIVKYHKQIWDVIVATWHAIEHFFVTDVGGFFTKTIPGWFKDVVRYLDTYLVQPLEKAFKTMWDWVTDNVWDPVEEFLTSTLAGWFGDVITLLTGTFVTPFEQGFKVAWQWLVTNVWNPVETFFTKTLPGWFTATIKFLKDNLITPLQDGLKAAWQWVVTNVWDPVETLFTKTLPGWFGDAITFLKNTFVTPFENAFKEAWTWVVTNVWDPVDTFFTKTLVGWFDTARTDIRNVWEGILSDITSIVHQIEQAVSSVTSLPGKILGDVGIHLAGGGVLPGYAPGHDSLTIKASPGEAVLVPEAVRAIGAGNINAINARFSAGRAKGGDGAYAGGGVIPDPYAGAVRHYADGGMVPGGGLSPFQAGQAAGQQYSAMNSAGSTVSGDGLNVTFQYYGPQAPTPEQERAMMSRLAMMIGAM